MTDILKELDEVLMHVDDPHLLADFFESNQQQIRAALELKARVDAVRGADKAIVFDDNSIYHDADCDPKHYGRVLIIPASVLEGKQ